MIDILNVFIDNSFERGKFPLLFFFIHQTHFASFHIQKQRKTSKNSHISIFFLAQTM